MSTRERWIVYPLLFLAIGLGLRNKLFPPSRFGGGEETVIHAAEIDAKLIRCGELQTPRAFIRQAEIRQSNCGKMIVVRPDGSPAVVVYADQRTLNGVLETLSGSGKPLVMLRSTNGGGLVATLNESNGVTGLMGTPAVYRPEGPEPKKPAENENTEKPAEDAENPK